jgi:transposase
MKKLNRFNKGRGPGRPSVLTKELIAEFRKLLVYVAYMDTIASYLGVDRSTWRKWLKRGRTEWNRLNREGEHAEVLESEEIYLEFFASYKKGLAESEIRDCTLIAKAAEENWTAAAWRLERRFPQRWGSNAKEIRELAKKVEELEKCFESQDDKKTRSR